MSRLLPEPHTRRSLIPCTKLDCYVASRCTSERDHINQIEISFSVFQVVLYLVGVSKFGDKPLVVHRCSHYLSDSIQRPNTVYEETPIVEQLICRLVSSAPFPRMSDDRSKSYSYEPKQAHEPFTRSHLESSNAVFDSTNTCASASREQLEWLRDTKYVL